MKARNEQLEERIDVVVKLIWTHTLLQTLFRKQHPDAEVRRAHPEFFLATHDSFLCSFCVAVEILFEKKAKATSLWSLIRQVEPQLARKPEARIQAQSGLIKNIEAIRHQLCAHRWQAKLPQQVFAETQPRISTMTEIAKLVRFLILELAGQSDNKRRAELEKQKLSASTLSCVADDAVQILHAFRLTDGSLCGT